MDKLPSALIPETFQVTIRPFLALRSSSYRAGIIGRAALVVDEIRGVRIGVVTQFAGASAVVRFADGSPQHITSTVLHLLK